MTYVWFIPFTNMNVVVICGIKIISLSIRMVIIISWKQSFFDFFQSAVFPPLCYILRVLLNYVKSFFLWGIFDLWLIFNLGCVQIFSILLIFFCFFFTIAAARWWRIFRSAIILFYALLISSWCLILLSLNLCKLLSKYFLDLSVFFYFLVEFSLSKLFLDGLLYFWSDIYSFCRQIYNC